MGGDIHDATYYFKCMIGGTLACGLTHTAIVPLDVVKCRRQVFRPISLGVPHDVQVVGRWLKDHRRHRGL